MKADGLRKPPQGGNIMPNDLGKIVFTPLSRGRALQKGPDYARGLFERSEFPRAPDLSRSTEVPKDRVTGRPFFWFFSLGEQRKRTKITFGYLSEVPTTGEGFRSKLNRDHIHKQPL
jgi:hypothetical protein